MLVHWDGQKAGEQAYWNEVYEPFTEDEKAKASELNSKFSSLENLLSEKKQDGPKIESSEDEKHFCRDCIQFVAHPFLSRCELHRKNVNPMDDCLQFKKKTISSPKG